MSLLLVLIGIALFALFSGPISRGSLTPPMVFVLLGLVLSPVGLGWIELTVDNKVVHVIAEITLILVLFTDAARINLKHLWADHDLPLRLLLVGMPLTIVAGALAAKLILPELIIIEALILAVILAPTDAALGQVVVSSPRVPERIRQSLNKETRSMTDAIDSWLTPLLFISAPALMILSTAARYVQLHGEIHFLQDHGQAGAGGDVCNTALRRRATCFRNALVALYSAIAIFAIASLLGAIVSNWWSHALQWVAALTVVGIGAVIFAAVSLVREAPLSLRIISLHFDNLDPD